VSKPTEKQIEAILSQKHGKNYSWDDAGAHAAYDAIIEERLRELDPEFVEALEKLIEGVHFWYE